MTEESEPMTLNGTSTRELGVRSERRGAMVTGNAGREGVESREDRLTATNHLMRHIEVFQALDLRFIQRDLDSRYRLLQMF